MTPWDPLDKPLDKPFDVARVVGYRARANHPDGTAMLILPMVGREGCRNRDPPRIWDGFHGIWKRWAATPPSGGSAASNAGAGLKSQVPAYLASQVLLYLLAALAMEE